MVKYLEVMSQIIQELEQSQKKSKVVNVRSGDTVRVHQRIKEGSKERVQVFEGLAIRTRRGDSLTRTITVRRVASGVGVEKSFMVHSPLVEKIEVVKRAKVRRNYLSYMRERSGKAVRLESVAFDKDAVNDVSTPETAVEPKVPDEVEEEKAVPKEAPVNEAEADKTPEDTPSKESEEKADNA